MHTYVIYYYCILCIHINAIMENVAIVHTIFFLVQKFPFLCSQIYQSFYLYFQWFFFMARGSVS